jgi:hypothetical protein
MPYQKINNLQVFPNPEGAQFVFSTSYECTPMIQVFKKKTPFFGTTDKLVQANIPLGPEGNSHDIVMPYMDQDTEYWFQIITGPSFFTLTKTKIEVASITLKGSFTTDQRKVVVSYPKFYVNDDGDDFSDGDFRIEAFIFQRKLYQPRFGMYINSISHGNWGTGSVIHYAFDTVTIKEAAPEFKVALLCSQDDTTFSDFRWVSISDLNQEDFIRSDSDGTLFYKLFVYLDRQKGIYQPKQINTEIQSAAGLDINVTLQVVIDISYKNLKPPYFTLYENPMIIDGVDLTWISGLAQKNKLIPSIPPHKEKEKSNAKSQKDARASGHFSLFESDKAHFFKNSNFTIKLQLDKKGTLYYQLNCRHPIDRLPFPQWKMIDNIQVSSLTGISTKDSDFQLYAITFDDQLVSIKFKNILSETELCDVKYMDIKSSQPPVILQQINGDTYLYLVDTIGSLLRILTNDIGTENPEFNIDVIGENFDPKLTLARHDSDYFLFAINQEGELMKTKIIEEIDSEYSWECLGKVPDDTYNIYTSKNNKYIIAESLDGFIYITSIESDNHKWVSYPQVEESAEEQNKIEESF